MSGHKFKVGQSVHYTAGDIGNICEVMQALPCEGENFQYRIKCAGEPHQRLVKEYELYPAITHFGETSGRA